MCVCASTKLVQNYLQDKKTPFSIAGFHIHTHIHSTHTDIQRSRVGPEKISSWSHRYKICSWIFMVCVDVQTCVCVVVVVWVKESKDADKQRQSSREYTVCAEGECGQEKCVISERMCDWPCALTQIDFCAMSSRHNGAVWRRTRASGGRDCDTKEEEREQRGVGEWRKELEGEEVGGYCWNWKK